MSTPRAAWLLRLYPRAWRRRYAAEFAELLAGERTTPRLILDLALGALDAHLFPQLAGGGRREHGARRARPRAIGPAAAPPRAALRARALVVAALVVLALLAGSLRQNERAARLGTAIADHLSPIATAERAPTVQDYSRPALRHE